MFNFYPFCGPRHLSGSSLLFYVLSDPPPLLCPLLSRLSALLHFFLSKDRMTQSGPSQPCREPIRAALPVMFSRLSYVPPMLPVPPMPLDAWPTFTTRGTLIEEISEQTFRKERRRLQAKHLWMEVRLSWHVLAAGCTHLPLLESHVNNCMHCFSTRLPGAAQESL